MDIAATLMEQLDRLFPECEVYGESIEQGFQQPCFSVRVVTAARSGMPSGRYHVRNSFDVRYFPLENAEEGEGGNAACRMMAERLLDKLEVLNSEARASGMEWRIEDGVLHFLVDYNLFLRREAESGPMESLLTRAGTKGMNMHGKAKGTARTGENTGNGAVFTG